MLNLCINLLLYSPENTQIIQFEVSKHFKEISITLRDPMSYIYAVHVGIYHPLTVLVPFLIKIRDETPWVKVPRGDSHTWTPRSPYLEPYNSPLPVKVDRLASVENVCSPGKSNPSLGKFEWKYNEINWFSISNQWNLISNIGCRGINDIFAKTFPGLVLVAGSKCRL